MLLCGHQNCPIKTIIMATLAVVAQQVYTTPADPYPSKTAPAVLSFFVLLSEGD